MPRALRPRKERVNYNILVGHDHGSESPQAGPSDIADDNGSDFTPPLDEAAPEVERTFGIEDDDDIEYHGSPEVEPVSVKAKGKGKKRSVIPRVGTSTDHVVDGVSEKSKRPLLPSANHRHRAPPLFTRPGAIERLTSRPHLFAAPSLASTNNYTHNARITRKLNLLWGQNVGPGPIWELSEDRAWFKEGNLSVDIPESEGQRRPLVHQNVKIMNGWEILNPDAAARYLPYGSATDDGNIESQPPVTCLFGPFGNQTRTEMALGQSVYLSQSGSHVFNAGAPVWGLDWCPIHSSDRNSRSLKQYLAVATFPSHSHSPGVGVRLPRPSSACIQIWSFASDGSSENGQVVCEMAVCIDSGAAHDLKWCPLPSHDRSTELVGPRKLGLLAGIFEDGSFSIFAIPDPKDLRQHSSGSEESVYVRLPEPVLRIELEHAACTAFDWANSELVAIGNNHGAIGVYNIGRALQSFNERNAGPIADLVPTHYMSEHQSCIRSLCWIRTPPSSTSGAPLADQDPTVLVSGGYDGSQCLIDVREGRGTVVNRTRDVINAITFSPYDSVFVSVDHENIVKGYSISPSMLGRGHILADCDGPIWDMHGSDYHPHLAVGCADGFCLTTNMLRSTRRGTIPFFVHRIYQLDYNRTSGEYRMLEQFIPRELTIQTASGNSGRGQKPLLKTVGTDAWPREVGIHRVVWNTGNGLAAAGMLASGTAAGLCRIDVLTGRWNKNRGPPSLNQVRGEDDDLEDDMEIDVESGIDE